MCNDISYYVFLCWCFALVFLEHLECDLQPSPRFPLWFVFAKTKNEKLLTEQANCEVTGWASLRP